MQSKIFKTEVPKEPEGPKPPSPTSAALSANFLGDLPQRKHEGQEEQQQWQKQLDEFIALQTTSRDEIMRLRAEEEAKVAQHKQRVKDKIQILQEKMAELKVAAPQAAKRRAVSTEPAAAGAAMAADLGNEQRNLAQSMAAAQTAKDKEADDAHAQLLAEGDQMDVDAQSGGDGAPKPSLVMLGSILTQDDKAKDTPFGKMLKDKGVLAAAAGSPY